MWYLSQLIITTQQLHLFLDQGNYYFFFTFTFPSNICLDQILAMIPEADDFSCAGDGLFPDPPSACRGYFRCSGDKLWRYNCPPGLRFDASIGSCNWELLVNDDCNAVNITSVTSTTISTTSVSSTTRSTTSLAPSNFSTILTDSTIFGTFTTALLEMTTKATSTASFPIVAPVVIDQSEESREDDDNDCEVDSTLEHFSFKCPGNGLYPDAESDFTGYFRCDGEKVKKDIALIMIDIYFCNSFRYGDMIVLQVSSLTFALVYVIGLSL